MLTVVVAVVVVVTALGSTVGGAVAVIMSVLSAGTKIKRIKYKILFI